ncbi:MULTISPECIES: hypothetical protein [unclassified Brevundimonas]|jgi:hypothetical protein|uniref:hypothetical protein n=1 Tax=unclassified Brevundimonas TaxID=2622653 RepID=UPI001A1E04B9|nr:MULTISPECIES: hypothetical protein [unclassified Brevundimonas]MBJ7484150.1 hypothetical protein [Brevundimonas sp.]WGM45191.1 hypothetical protein KOAAANKH_00051 [Brevundimonas sp. NIBR10]
MSQHNISGSEAFDRTPKVYIRNVRTGGMRRRRTRTAIAFVAGAAAAIVGGVVGAIVLFGPGLAGG